MSHYRIILFTLLYLLSASLHLEHHLLPEAYQAHYPPSVLTSQCSNSKSCKTIHHSYFLSSEYIHHPHVDLFPHDIASLSLSTSSFRKDLAFKTIMLQCKTNKKYLNFSYTGSHETRDHIPWASLITTAQPRLWNLRKGKYGGYVFESENRKLFFKDQRIVAAETGNDYFFALKFITPPVKEEENFADFLRKTTEMHYDVILVDLNEEMVVRCREETGVVATGSLNTANLVKDVWRLYIV